MKGPLPTRPKIEKKNRIYPSLSKFTFVATNPPCSSEEEGGVFPLLNSKSEIKVASQPPPTIAKGEDPEAGEVDWSNLEEEAASYNPHSPPYYTAAVASAPSQLADPNLDLKTKIAHLEERMRLQARYHKLSLQLQQIQLTSSSNSDPAPPLWGRGDAETTLKPPLRGGVDADTTLTPPPAPAALSAFPPPKKPFSAASVFPVIEAPDVQGHLRRYHQPHNFQHLKELKTAVTQYGASAPFTLTILDSIAEGWLTPLDWQTLVKAALDSGDHLLWRTKFQDLCTALTQF
ncbi:uncharacterized protein LOC129145853 [Talpa occidentalis]|uniref:uncharacterized protein LOC129145853 n=1 Tax=Talpa occidentalis TaxID=50954 RepID=UPI0023F96877|nr:uncharacterized protein LOC129145853 [Talpa occidentalis]